MTAQIIYGTDFKAKAEKEREEILKICEEAWASGPAIPSNWSEQHYNHPVAVPFVAPETDPA